LSQIIRMNSTELHTEHSHRVTKRALPRVAFGIAEVADALGVSPGFIRLEIARKQLVAFRAGRRVLITKASFDAYTARVAD
jgi:excisionase family DNA binding protein